MTNPNHRPKHVIFTKGRALVVEKTMKDRTVDSRVLWLKLHQHRPQTVGYSLGHILCLFSLNATDLRCLCGFIWFLSPNGDDMPVWFQSAPGLHHDYGQITTSVVLLGVQVTDVRRGYLGGRRRRRRRRDYIMTLARSQPL